MMKSLLCQHIQFPSNSKDWHSVVCKVCNDHGRKGPRAGFKFEDDVVGYHCFNCGYKATYNPAKNKSIPKKMIQVLEAFGIDSTSWEPIVFANLQKTFKIKQRDSKPKLSEPNEIECPDDFYYVHDAKPNDKWAEIAIHYLNEERKIDPNSYPFMLCRALCHHDNKMWRKRLIVPVYKNDKLIFWQGRTLSNAPKKYLNPKIKQSVLYGYDQLHLHQNLNKPLYIVEGWFDAFLLNGIAVFGNDMTEQQIQWINSSSRTKVYIPDRYGDGQIGANKALYLDWNVSTPDIGKCKDINEAFIKYGKLYTMTSIIEHTCAGFKAKIAIKLYCK